MPDCLGGLSRVGISSRSTRPWNGQPPSIDYAVTFYEQSGGYISYNPAFIATHINTCITTSESRPTTMIKYVSSKDNKHATSGVRDKRTPTAWRDTGSASETKKINRREVNNNRCTSTNLVFFHPSYCSGWNSSPSQNMPQFSVSIRFRHAVDGISGDSYKHAVDLGDCGEHVSAISEIIIWRTPYNYLASAI